MMSSQTRSVHRLSSVVGATDVLLGQLIQFLQDFLSSTGVVFGERPKL